MLLPARVVAFAIILIGVSVLLYLNAVSIALSTHDIHHKVAALARRGLRETATGSPAHDLTQGSRVSNSILPYLPNIRDSPQETYSAA